LTKAKQHATKKTKGRQKKQKTTKIVVFLKPLPPPFLLQFQTNKRANTERKKIGLA